MEALIGVAGVRVKLDPRRGACGGQRGRGGCVTEAL